jgi:hypothetical protein
VRLVSKVFVECNVLKLLCECKGHGRIYNVKYEVFSDLGWRAESCYGPIRRRKCWVFIWFEYSDNLALFPNIRY